ncbi:hypothetical protein AAF712_012016, partial [Marasmius tenuissimus]
LFVPPAIVDIHHPQHSPPSQVSSRQPPTIGLPTLQGKAMGDSVAFTAGVVEETGEAQLIPHLLLPSSPHLLLLVGLSLTIIKLIYLVRAYSVRTGQPATSIATKLRFGVWGVCASSELDAPTAFTNDGLCYGPKLSYGSLIEQNIPADLLARSGLNSQIVNTVLSGLPGVLILHLITAGFSLVGLAAALYLASHELTILSLVVTVVTALLMTVVFGINVALVLATKSQIRKLTDDAVAVVVAVGTGNGVWMVLGVMIAAAIQIYVLRKKPAGQLLSQTAHEVDREYTVLKALYDYNSRSSTPPENRVPIPQPYLLCEDENVIGTKFYVMEFLDGRIFTDMRLLDLKDEDWKEIFRGTIHALARLSSVKPEEIGLSKFGPSSDYFPRQIKLFTQISEAQANSPASQPKYIAVDIKLPENSGLIVSPRCGLNPPLDHPPQPPTSTSLSFQS